VWVALVLLAVALPTVAAHAQGAVIAWDPSTGFAIPAHGMAIFFAGTAYFMGFGWDSWNASMIFFNVMLDNDDAPLNTTTYF